LTQYLGDKYVILVNGNMGAINGKQKLQTWIVFALYNLSVVFFFYDSYRIWGIVLFLLILKLTFTTVLSIRTWLVLYISNTLILLYGVVCFTIAFLEIPWYYRVLGGLMGIPVLFHYLEKLIEKIRP